MILPLHSCLNPLAHPTVCQQASPLLDGLVAYWKLNEASGVTKVDSLGAHDLADVYGVGNGTGLIGTCASFNGATYTPLSAAHHADLSIGNNPWSMWLWFRLDTLPPADGTTMNLVTKWSVGASNEEYLVDYFRYPDSWSLRFIAKRSEGGYAVPTITTPITAGVWHAVLCYHDPVGQVIGISMHNGEDVTWPVTSGLATAPVPLLFGGFFNADRNHNGLLDEVGIWRRLLTSTERTRLYNGGMGRSYPFN